MYFNNKYFKFFAPDDELGNGENDLDVNKFEKVEDIDSQLDNIDESPDFLKDGDDISLEDNKVEPSEAPLEDKVKDDTSTEEKPKEDDVKAEDKNTVDDDLSLVKEIPSEEDKVETDKEDDPSVITSEYIDTIKFSDDAEKNETLKANFKEKYEGKPVGELVKAHAHAQQLIGKKTEIPKLSIDLPEENKNAPQQPKGKDEIETARDEFVFKQLKQEYPELPKDKAEQKKWLADLNYEDREAADKFLSAKREHTGNLDKVWNATEKLSREYPEINASVTKNEIKAIENYVLEVTGKTVKQLGYDFTIDAEGNNSVIDKLLMDGNNSENFDKEVIQRWNGIPLIRQGSIAKKFVATEGKNFFGKALALARQEAVATKTDKKLAPSLSIQPSKGVERKEVSTDQISQITDVDQIDKLLDEEDDKDFN